jgi:hypothetical protein
MGHSYLKVLEYILLLLLLLLGGTGACARGHSTTWATPPVLECILSDKHLPVPPKEKKTEIPELQKQL